MRLSGACSLTVVYHSAPQAWLQAVPGFVQGCASAHLLQCGGIVFWHTCLLTTCIAAPTQRMLSHESRCPSKSCSLRR